MKYISTRGQAPELSFEEAILTGLASDGGLYVPKSLPSVSQGQLEQWKTLSYPELVYEVIQPFVGDDIPSDDLKQIIVRSYQNFRHSAIAPLVQIDRNQWVLELFHGPTLAFKDFALQFLGQLLDYILEKRQQRVVVMGATSGDTGSAAIEGCRNCKNIDIFILHPYQRVSEVQRRQMTSVISDNVFNIALHGNFDDCQNLVKASFKDQSFLPSGQQLVAINSINWARIMAQIVYYFYASFALGGPQRKVSFSVPTGNFGDIYAGYLAKSMGLPIDQLIIATNKNDILHRCIANNDHSVQELQPSMSPSMDIMVSSNFERLLFDLHEQDGDQISRLMANAGSGEMALSDSVLQQARSHFSSFRVDDQQTIDAMQAVFKETGYVVDPHTAIGIAASQHCWQDKSVAQICLATAHPAKFPDALLQSGREIDESELPAHVANLYDRPEQYQILQNDIAEVQGYVSQNLHSQRD